MAHPYNPEIERNGVLPYDISILNNGSISLLTSNTRAGREWIENNVNFEEWQNFAGGIACEPHDNEDDVWQTLREHYE